jgi:creatinine amidohydrolase
MPTDQKVGGSNPFGRAQVDALIVVNGHGGNYVLANVVQEANADNGIQVGLYPSREDWTDARHAAGISSSNHDDMHAGELETSILLAAHPAYVRDGWQNSDYIASDRRYLTTLGMSGPDHRDPAEAAQVLLHPIRRRTT